ncbi:hypothetical protein [Streptomyces collinus]|uniref:Uncharacterized protein n=1 Tax=Streptomyces collinus (strain DSM 40733 / Tue 365) TaxID=1214242 RepID=S5VG02_STRC3|nr:hypothetical protein [Streptomyces collinus]AGS69477.1 hypothetical protein B446_13295 [Streptomyces collinus Tu 365]UJA08117.1 hypothetical protein HGI10_20230 [Streptomyces collinus]UJA17018.1 hypothetical protein HGI09_43880 [Streptomyces collinus]
MRIDRLAAPELSELWSLREDVTVGFDGDDVLLRTPWGRRTVPRPARSVREALRRMLLGPVSLANVVPGFPGYDVPEEHWDDASRELLTVLDAHQDVVVRHLAVGATVCLSVLPVAPRAGFRPTSAEPGGRARLRDDVLVRREGRTTVLHSPRLHHRLELHGPEAERLLHWLSGRRDGTPAHPPPAVARAARCYAAAAGLLAERVAPGGGSPGFAQGLLNGKEDSL